MPTLSLGQQRSDISSALEDRKSFQQAPASLSDLQFQSIGQTPALLQRMFIQNKVASTQDDAFLDMDVDEATRNEQDRHSNSFESRKARLPLLEVLGSTSEDNSTRPPLDIFSPQFLSKSIAGDVQFSVDEANNPLMPSYQAAEMPAVPAPAAPPSHDFLQYPSDVSWPNLASGPLSLYDSSHETSFSDFVARLQATISYITGTDLTREAMTTAERAHSASQRALQCARESLVAAEIANTRSAVALTFVDTIGATLAKVKGDLEELNAKVEEQRQTLQQRQPRLEETQPAPYLPISPTSLHEPLSSEALTSRPDVQQGAASTAETLVQGSSISARRTGSSPETLSHQSDSQASAPSQLSRDAEALEELDERRRKEEERARLADEARKAQLQRQQDERARAADEARMTQLKRQQDEMRAKIEALKKKAYEEKEAAALSRVADASSSSNIPLVSTSQGDSNTTRAEKAADTKSTVNATEFPKHKSADLVPPMVTLSAQPTSSGSSSTASKAPSPKSVSQVPLKKNVFSFKPKPAVELSVDTSASLQKTHMTTRSAAAADAISPVVVHAVSLGLRTPHGPASPASHHPAPISTSRTKESTSSSHVHDRSSVPPIESIRTPDSPSMPSSDEQQMYHRAGQSGKVSFQPGSGRGAPSPDAKLSWKHLKVDHATSQSSAATTQATAADVRQPKDAKKILPKVEPSPTLLPAIVSSQPSVPVPVKSENEHHAHASLAEALNRSFAASTSVPLSRSVSESHASKSTRKESAQLKTNLIQPAPSTAKSQDPDVRATTKVSPSSKDTTTTTTTTKTKALHDESSNMQTTPVAKRRKLPDPKQMQFHDSTTAAVPQSTLARPISSTSADKTSAASTTSTSGTQGGSSLQKRSPALTVQTSRPTVPPLQTQNIPHTKAAQPISSLSRPTASASNASKAVPTSASSPLPSKVVPVVQTKQQPDTQPARKKQKLNANKGNPFVVQLPASLPPRPPASAVDNPVTPNSARPSPQSMNRVPSLHSTASISAPLSYPPPTSHSRVPYANQRLNPIDSASPGDGGWQAFNQGGPSRDIADAGSPVDRSPKQKPRRLRNIDHFSPSPDRMDARPPQPRSRQLPPEPASGYKRLREEDTYVETYYPASASAASYDSSISSHREDNRIPSYDVYTGPPGVRNRYAEEHYRDVHRESPDERDRQSVPYHYEAASWAPAVTYQPRTSGTHYSPLSRSPVYDQSPPYRRDHSASYGNEDSSGAESNLSPSGPPGRSLLNRIGNDRTAQQNRNNKRNQRRNASGNEFKPGQSH